MDKTNNMNESLMRTRKDFTRSWEFWDICWEKKRMKEIIVTLGIRICSNEHKFLKFEKERKAKPTTGKTYRQKCPP